MKYIYYLLIPAFLSLFSTMDSAGQNAPVTTATTIANASPGLITVPLTVTGFTDIGAISLTLEYDHSVLNFIQGIKNPLLPGSFIASDMDLGNGFHRITMGWFGIPAVSLANGSSIMDLQFTYIAGMTPLNWFDNGGSCEYADGNFNVLNDIPMTDYYINGYVCGVIGTPGPVAGNDTVCSGQSGEPYTIAPVLNATGYTWTVPDGVSIITGQNTNSIMVDFTVNALSGLIGVMTSNTCGNGPSSELAVTVNDLPVANAGADFSIPYGTTTTLSAASGGPGTYAYHWSPEALLVDPDVQNPQTILMTYSAVFTLIVTNLATLCQNSDDVVVTITGGPLSVNPQAFPSILCNGGSSQLYSNASGGSGNYSYNWTSDPPGTPPWTSNLPNPIVTPDSSLHYLLAVNDGFNTASGSTNVLVRETPTATISGGDTLCGLDATALLRVDLTGTPPWNFTYSFDNTSIFIYNQQTSPYLIVAIDPGDYLITSIEDANCTGESFGTAMVRKYPIPSTPEITQNLTELISSSCCGNQWYLNDTDIPGATGQTYIATVSGMYFVVVTLNGCSSEPSEVVDVIVGIDEYDLATFSFFPNPLKTNVSIQSSVSITGNVKVSLCSAAGIGIREYDFPNGGSTFSMYLGNIPSGLYFLIFSYNGIRSVKKLIVE
jgi:hypothetical protein